MPYSLYGDPADTAHLSDAIDNHVLGRGVPGGDDAPVSYAERIEPVEAHKDELRELVLATGRLADAFERTCAQMQDVVGAVKRMRDERYK